MPADFTERAKSLTDVFVFDFNLGVEIFDDFVFMSHARINVSDGSADSRSRGAPSAGVTLSLDKVTKTRGHSPF